MKYRIVTHNRKYRIQFQDFDWKDDEQGITQCDQKWEFHKTIECVSTTFATIPFETIFETSDIFLAEKELKNLQKKSARVKELQAHEAGPWVVVEELK